MSWAIEFEPAAHRQLLELHRSLQERILRSLARLAVDPKGSRNVTALTGGGYRLRAGDWRIVYDLDEKERVVVVIRVAHRREAYR